MTIKKISLLSFFVFISTLSFGQLKSENWYAGFDNVIIGKADSFLNGETANGSFHNGWATFYNKYNSEWKSWTGFAISNSTDKETRGYTNQYSSISGGGFQGTNQFTVLYQEGHIKLDVPQSITGFWFNANTYTYWDLIEGSQFSKKFGGESGDDEDSLMLVVSGYLKGELVKSEKAPVADYRFGNASEDYIVTDWEWFNMGGFGEIDSVMMSFESSDNGTPTYVCIDDFNGIDPVLANNMGFVALNGLLGGGESSDNQFKGAGGFKVYDAIFNNNYNPTWKSWKGWSLSKVDDPSTKGLANQFATAAENVGQYAVGNGAGAIRLAHKKEARNKKKLRTSITVSNNAYTYWSMKEGDQFAKKFGGETGDDKDYLKLIVEAFDAQGNRLDSAHVFLADYRFDDNSKDYIADEWIDVELVIDNSVSIFNFTLESSDVGQYGMNTPYYYCVLFVNNAIFVDVEEVSPLSFNVFPNPAQEHIQWTMDNIEKVTVYNMNGRKMEVTPHHKSINIASLPKGMYLIVGHDGDKWIKSKFVKI